MRGLSLKTDHEVDYFIEDRPYTTHIFCCSQDVQVLWIWIQDSDRVFSQKPKPIENNWKTIIYNERWHLLGRRRHLLHSPKPNSSLFCKCIKRSVETNYS